MKQARTRRLAFSLLTSAIVLAAVGQIDAEMIFFANGRTMSVKDYRIAGDVITVTLRHGGEATFSRAIVAHIAPDELLEPEAGVATVARAASAIRPLAARPFADLIHTVALKHGIDPALVHAMVQAESNYRPAARSQVGARGLMQVMPATAKDFGVKSATMLLDPQANLEAGVQYLKFLLARFDLTNAIAAYNAGPAAVRKYDGIPPFPETRDYVKKVLSNFRQ